MDNGILIDQGADPAMRAAFDLDPALIYLNSGTLSITPRVVAAAVRRHQTEAERNPTAALVRVWERLWAVQQALGRFFGADPADLFLRPNVTLVMNELVLGLTLPAGGAIALTDHEYGAVANICRYRAEREGRELRTVALPLEPAAVVPAILGQLGADAALLVVSQVVSATGSVLPIAELARETRRRGVRLLVDGAHGPGALALDFRTLDDLDGYGGNLHKWMMGPKGSAFGWVPRRRQGELAPLTAGWTTYEPLPPIFAGFGDGSTFALRLLPPGCRDFAPFLAIADLLELWGQWGEQAVRGRLAHLRQVAVAAMARQVGWPLVTPAGEGPLLAYRLPPHLEAEGNGLMLRLLRERGLQVASTHQGGRWLLRLSPHVYNSAEEIERAAEILARL